MTKARAFAMRLFDARSAAEGGAIRPAVQNSPALVADKSAPNVILSCKIFVEYIKRTEIAKFVCSGGYC